MGSRQRRDSISSANFQESGFTYSSDYLEEAEVDDNKNNDHLKVDDNKNSDNLKEAEVDDDDDKKNSESVVPDEKMAAAKKESRFLFPWFHRKQKQKQQQQKHHRSAHSVTEVFVDIESVVEYNDNVSESDVETGNKQSQQGEKQEPKRNSIGTTTESFVTVLENSEQEEKISCIAPWYHTKQKPNRDSGESVREIQRPQQGLTKQKQKRDFLTVTRKTQKQRRSSGESARENKRQQEESTTSWYSARQSRDLVTTEGSIDGVVYSEYSVSNPDLAGQSQGQKQEGVTSWNSQKSRSNRNSIRDSIRHSSVKTEGTVMTYNTSVIESEYLNNVINAKEEGEKKPTTAWSRQKRLWVVGTAVILLLLAAFIPTLILMVLPAVYEKVVDDFIIDFSELYIEPPITDGNFFLSLKGQVTNAGSLRATISFNNYVEVQWKNNTMGKLQLPSFTVASNGQADIAVNTTFYISDNKTFTDFNAFQLNNMQFTWILNGEARVRALGVTRDKLEFIKEVTMPGGNGFPGTRVDYLDVKPLSSSTLLLNFTMDLVNPSPISIQLGTFGVDLFSGNTHLGHATATDFSLNTGLNYINFNGVAISQTIGDSLDDVSELVARYISGIPVDLTVKFRDANLDGISRVSWLNDALQTVTLNASLRGYPRQIITDIDIGSINLLNLGGTPTQIIPYPNITANYSLPLDFPFNITRAEQNITVYDRSNNSICKLFSPWTNATNDDTRFYLNSTATWLYVNDDQKSNFSQFVSAFSLGDASAYQLASIFGISVATPIGSITLTNIQFNTTASSNHIRSLSTPR